MKVLWITSDCAGTVMFEEHFNVEDIASQLTANGDAKSFEGDEYYFEAKLLEFGDIDPKFIEFVQEQVQDYDQKKDCNFYVVGTEQGESMPDKAQVPWEVVNAGRGLRRKWIMTSDEGVEQFVPVEGLDEEGDIVKLHVPVESFLNSLGIELTGASSATAAPGTTIAHRRAANGK